MSKSYLHLSKVGQVSGVGFFPPDGLALFCYNKLHFNASPCPPTPHMSTADINQFKKVIAMAGRRQCVFLKPVEQVESILGSLGTVFWWLAVILFSDGFRENC